MRSLMAFISMCCASYCAGQGTPITQFEFLRIFERGIGHSRLREGNSLRYKRTEEHRSLFPVEIVEIDEKGTVRAIIYEVETGQIDSESIVFGDQIYERTKNGHWTLLTHELYVARQKLRRGAMNNALAAGDNKKYRELSASYNAASSAALIKSPFSSYGAIGNLTPDAVYTYTGTGSYNGRKVSTYRVDRIAKDLKPGLIECIVYLSYWFDEETRILLKARTNYEWVYTAKTETYTMVYEWEYDPSIRIVPPLSQPVIR
jgi:hypothetical protein